MDEVPYAPVKSAESPRLRIQLLVDASGSMTGFEPDIRRVFGAFEQGVSYSRDVYFRVASERSCFFSQKRGVFGCADKLNPGRFPTAPEFTNLDSAVRESEKADITIILTDGVPASEGARANCSAGVDAGCVAIALADALKPRPGEANTQVYGLWFVPLMLMYRGTYYSEQPVALEQFSPDVALRAIQRDTGTSANITRPALDSQHDLKFQYDGPRMIAALVVSNSPDAARSLIAETYRHLAVNVAQPINSPNQFKNGVAFVPPVEVFPGLIPQPHWSDCKQATDAEGGKIEHGGSFDTCTVSGNRVLVRCGAEQAEAPFVITAADQSVVTFRNVATFNIQYPPSTGMLLNSKWQQVGRTLETQLRCTSKQPIKCDSNEAHMTWAATPIYKWEPTASSAQYIDSLSTDHPAYEPHRVYGMASLLHNLYERSGPARQFSFAEAEVCSE
jgi:hypothetical protein